MGRSRRHGLLEQQHRSWQQLEQHSRSYDYIMPVKQKVLASITAQNVNQLQSASYMDFKLEGSDSIIHQLYVRFDIGNSAATSTTFANTITLATNPLFWLSSVEVLNTSGDRIQEVYAEALFTNLMFVDNDKLDILMEAGAYSSSPTYGSNSYNTINPSVASGWHLHFSIFLIPFQYHQPIDSFVPSLL